MVVRAVFIYLLTTLPSIKRNHMTLNVKQLAFIFIVFTSFYKGNAQLGFSHEIGAIIGPVEFRSDFGSRFDERTNLGNSGIGIGIMEMEIQVIRDHINLT